MRIINLLASIILVIGGLNWLSVGIFEFDIVAGIFGGPTMLLSKIVYILVGLATLYLIYAVIADHGKLNVNVAENEIK